MEELAEKRYSRGEGLPGYYRWGREKRSIFLSDQKVRITAPRVRDSVKNKEVCLRILELLKQTKVKINRCWEMGKEGVLINT